MRRLPASGSRPSRSLTTQRKAIATCDGDAGALRGGLARALAHVINILDPDVIVLGGGLSNLDRLFERGAALWGAWVFSDRVDTRLVRHAHGDSSGVRGAAWLGGRQRRESIADRAR